MVKLSNKTGLSSNLIKVIGAITMVVDHIGFIFFPDCRIFRIIGRLSFPIFSFLIFEGCRHTKNKKLYLSRILILGIITSTVYCFVMKELYLNVLITFSCSIILVYSVQYLKKSNNLKEGFFRLSVFAFLCSGVYFLTEKVTVDYDTFGVLLPVFPAVVSRENKNNRNKLTLLNIEFWAFVAGLLIMSFARGGVQFYGLLSVPLIALYNGKKGFNLPKYFFYIFYPTHLVVLWLVKWFIST